MCELIYVPIIFWQTIRKWAFIYVQIKYNFFHDNNIIFENITVSDLWQYDIMKLNMFTNLSW